MSPLDERIAAFMALREASAASIMGGTRLMAKGGNLEPVTTFVSAAHNDAPALLRDLLAERDALLTQLAESDRVCEAYFAEIKRAQQIVGTLRERAERAEAALREIDEVGTRIALERVGDPYRDDGWQRHETVSKEARIARAVLKQAEEPADDQK